MQANPPLRPLVELVLYELVDAIRKSLRQRRIVSEDTDYVSMVHECSAGPLPARLFHIRTALCALRSFWKTTAVHFVHWTSRVFFPPISAGAPQKGHGLIWVMDAHLRKSLHFSGVDAKADTVFV
jgi:hypothetical protein